MLFEKRVQCLNGPVSILTHLAVFDARIWAQRSQGNCNNNVLKVQEKAISVYLMYTLFLNQRN